MGDMEEFLCPGRPCRVLLGFNPLFPLTFLNPEGNKGGTKKTRIVLDKQASNNLAWELGFRGTQFQSPLLF